MLQSASMKKDIQLSAQSGEGGFSTESQILGKIPVSRRTLGNWKSKKLIPFVKIGRRCLYHWPSVEAALLREQK